MSDYYDLNDVKKLKAELEAFQKEKERIKKLIGGIGGKKYSRLDNVINAIFLVVVVFFFVMEVFFKVFPAYLSLEISVLLVSIKMVWMIHSTHQYNHFVFWILNTIEFKVNEVDKRLRAMEERKAEGPRQE